MCLLDASNEMHGSAAETCDSLTSALLAPTPAEDLDRRGNLHVFNVNELLRPHGETLAFLICASKRANSDKSRGGKLNRRGKTGYRAEHVRRAQMNEDRPRQNPMLPPLHWQRAHPIPPPKAPQTHQCATQPQRTQMQTHITQYSGTQGLPRPLCERAACAVTGRLL